MQTIKCKQLVKREMDYLKCLMEADMKVNELIGLFKMKINENTFYWKRQDYIDYIISLIGRNLIGENLEYTICIIQRAAAQLFTIYSN